MFLPSPSGNNTSVRLTKPSVKDIDFNSKHTFRLWIPPERREVGTESQRTTCPLGTNSPLDRRNPPHVIEEIRRTRTAIRTRTTRGAAAARESPPPYHSRREKRNSCSPLDVFGSDSSTCVARIQISAVPELCCGRSQAASKRGPFLSFSLSRVQRSTDFDAYGAKLRVAACLRRMAQNVNPFCSSQNTPNKAAEEKQNVPKDNHAVSKR